MQITSIRFCSLNNDFKVLSSPTADPFGIRGEPIASTQVYETMRLPCRLKKKSKWRARGGEGGEGDEGESVRGWAENGGTFSPITGRIYGIPFMLSFRERSQVTIPGLRRSRNEISFASPRGARVSGRTREQISFPGAAPPLASPVASVGEPPWRRPPRLSSLFQFSLRLEKSGGWCAPPGSLPEGSRRGTILFRVASLPSSSRRANYSLCTGLSRDIVFFFLRLATLFPFLPLLNDWRVISASARR